MYVLLSGFKGECSLILDCSVLGASDEGPTTRRMQEYQTKEVIICSPACWDLHWRQKAGSEGTQHRSVILLRR
jgi:hypothetical protein